MMELQQLSLMVQIVRLFTLSKEQTQLFRVQHTRHTNGVMILRAIYLGVTKKLHLRFTQIMEIIISNHNILIKITG